MRRQRERITTGPLHPHAPIDRAAKRYFVYNLRDADGTSVYVGRSCDVPKRLRSHFVAAQDQRLDADRRPTWIYDARSVSLTGPYSWDEANAAERAEIERHQPRGNRMFTRAHGYRPLADGGGRYYGSP